MAVPFEVTIPADILASESFQELGPEDGFEEGVNEQGPWARKPYAMAWLDRARFISAMTGAGQVQTGPGGPWIRPTRYRYPDTSFASNIFAKGFSVKAIGDWIKDPTTRKPVTPIAFTEAIVVVEFGMLDWMGFDPNNSFSPNPEENEKLQYATQEIDFDAEYTSVPNRFLRFADGTKIDSPFNIRVPVIKMKLVWHKLPYFPVTVLKDYVGTLNDSTWLGNSRGLVMFEGANTTREMDSEGNVVQKMAMSFKIRQNDWNMSLHPVNPVWMIVTSDVDPTWNPYVYRDFNDLLF
jgi:hypothetical protein